MKRLVLYISLLFLITDVFGQSSLQKRAENALRNNEYTFAINNFKSLFSQTENEDPQKAVIAYKIGYCYRHISSPLHAQLWLEKAIDLKYQEPIAYLYCADAMRMNGNFDKAISYTINICRSCRRTNGARKALNRAALRKSGRKTPQIIR